MLIHLLVGMQNSKATLENGLAVPYKVKQIYGPAIPLLSIYPREKNTCPQKHLSSFIYHRLKKKETTQLSIN